MEYKNLSIISFLKILLALSILLLPLNIMAQQDTEGVIFENISLSAGLKKSKDVNKLLFVDCYTSWCYPCKMMAIKIFPQKKMGDFFNNNFVNIKIDMEKGEGPEVAKKYGIKSYPTFLILNYNEQEIGRIVGGDGVDSFINRTKMAMDINNSPIEKKRLYDNDKTFYNAIAYLEALYVSNNQKDILLFLENELINFSISERYSQKMWKYIYLVITNHNSPLFDIILNDIAEACMLLGKDNVCKVLKSNTQNYLFSYLIGENPTAEKNLNAVEQRITILGLLSESSDLYSLSLKQICRAVMHNNFTKIAEPLSPFRVLDFSNKEIASIEKIIEALKDKIDPEIISHYYKVAKIFYQESLDKYNLQ